MDDSSGKTHVAVYITFSGGIEKVHSVGWEVGCWARVKGQLGVGLWDVQPCGFIALLRSPGVLPAGL